MKILLKPKNGIECLIFAGAAGVGISVAADTLPKALTGVLVLVIVDIIARVVYEVFRDRKGGEQS